MRRLLFSTLKVGMLNVVLGIGLPAFADDLDRLNRLDSQQQQRQQLQEKARERQYQTQADVRVDTAQSPLALPLNEQPCYLIHQILLTDYSPETPNDGSRFYASLDKAMKNLNLSLPHCFGAEGLSVLMKQVQNVIIEQGYITTRVVAQEQDLGSGKLVLTIILGKIGNTIVADSSSVPRFTKLHGWTAFSFKKGDVLNIRDIEQSLENLKRVPTAEANIEIIPSENVEQIGESDLKISYEQSLPFRLNLNVDDAGSRSTGKYQGTAAFSFDNIFSANDLFYSSLTRSLKTGEDQHGSRASHNVVLAYSIPFAYWQLSASQSYNRYRQEIFGAFDNSYLYSGKSNTTKIGLSYLLYRDSVRKTTLLGNIWSRQSGNFIDGSEIEVQKRRMSGWEIGISHKEYLGSNTLELSAHYKRGTGARGALAAPEEAFNEGTSRPKIIRASLSLLSPFSIGEQPWYYQTEWSAQWNKTPLITLDQFSIGGRYTVRGFDGELTLSGERGWLWRNELAWNIYGKGQQLYWALDAGRVSGISEYQVGQSLVGAAIGLKGGWKGFYYDVFLGKPLRKPEGFKTSKYAAGFNVGYSF